VQYKKNVPIHKIVFSAMKLVLLLVACLFGTIRAVQEEYGVGQRKFKLCKYYAILSTVSTKRVT
jgi:hypothetical protein